MKHLISALCSPYHVWILLFVAWIGTAVMIADGLGLISPNYHALIFTIVFAYWLGVAIELGLFGRRPQKGD